MRRGEHLVFLVCGIMCCVVWRSSGQETFGEFEGSPVTLPCPGFTRDQDVHWYRKFSILEKDVQILSRFGGKQTAVVPQSAPDEWKNGQISIVNDADLRITSLSKKRDNGTFYCRDPSSDDSKSVIVVVWDPVVPIRGVTIAGAENGTLTISVGVPKDLICMVDGSPSPPLRYTWRIGKINLTSNTESKKYSFRANYTMYGEALTCTAANYYPNNDSRFSSQDGTVNLNVTFLRAVIITPPSLTVKEGAAVRFECAAGGNPAPTFTWLNASGIVLSESSVYIRDNVPRSASGDIMCQASNIVGGVQVTVSLTVYYPPQLMVTYNTSTHTLMCTATDAPANYTFGLWEQNIGGQVIRELAGTKSGQESYILVLPSSLTYEDTGNYSCTVPYGTGEKQRREISVQPEVPPVFGDATQSSFTIGKGDSRDLSVCFYAHPPYSNVEWLKSGNVQSIQTRIEKNVLVTLPLRNGTARFPGFISTLENVMLEHGGEYTVRVSNVINSTTHTTEFVLFVDVSDNRGDPENYSILAPTIGAAAGLIALIIVMLSIIVLCRRRKHAKAETEEAFESMKQHNGQNGFDDPRWKEPDAEIADNDLYESAASIPVRIAFPSKPDVAKSRCLGGEQDLLSASSSLGKNHEGNQEMEMVENTLYESAGNIQITKHGKEKAAKKPKSPNKEKPSNAAKSQLPPSGDKPKGDQNMEMVENTLYESAGDGFHPQNSKQKTALKGPYQMYEIEEPVIHDQNTSVSEQIAPIYAEVD